MPNARELFNQIFKDFIRDGDPAFHVLLDHKSDGKLDWFSYIWGDNFSGPDKTFLERILHYFSLEQQDDREKIIQRLKNEGKKASLLFFYPKMIPTIPGSTLCFCSWTKLCTKKTATKFKMPSRIISMT